MNKYKNNLIWIFMNINVNIRNKRKLFEKLMWHTNKITSTPAANYPRLQDLVPKKMLRHSQMIKYTNYLIWIFMSINENIRNKRKLVEK